MINREDSALIARERQNRSPATQASAGSATNMAQTKAAAPGTRAKPPMRAGKSTSDR